MSGMEMYAAWLDSIKDSPDQTARDRLAEHLVECEEAHTILRARGWGQAGTSIVDVVLTVPERD
jgi:hypothetical protein